MKCEICNKYFNSLGKHISKAHEEISLKWYYDTYLKKFEEGICYCGKETKYRNLSVGYFKTCSQNCARKSQEAKEKFKKTCIDKYGKSTPLKVEEFKSRIKKTNLKKYGVENPFQSEEIKDKIKQTNLERYGTENSMQCEEIKEKSKQTFMNKYNVENPFQYEEIKDKIKQSNYDEFIVVLKKQLNEINLELVDEFYMNSHYKHSWNCLICNNTFIQNWNSIQQGFLCQKCNPRSGCISKPQEELFELISLIFKDAELEYKCLTYSIDIVIPSYKIAIEYDGSYWHEGREEYDKIRQERLEELGWKFIRYKDEIPEKSRLLSDINKCK